MNQPPAGVPRESEIEELRRRAGWAESVVATLSESVVGQLGSMSRELLTRRVKDLEAKAARDGARIGDLEAINRRVVAQADELTRRLNEAGVYVREIEFKVEGLKERLERLEPKPPAGQPKPTTPATGTPSAATTNPRK